MFVYNNVTSPSIHPSSHASLALLGAYETIPKPVCSESVQGLLIVGYVWNTSPRRCPGCIQIRCPQHCDGVLSLWKSSNSTLSPPPRMSDLLGWASTPYRGISFPPFVSILILSITTQITWPQVRVGLYQLIDWRLCFHAQLALQHNRLEQLLHHWWLC